MATKGQIQGMNTAILATTAKNNGINAPTNRKATNFVIQAEIASEKSATESAKPIKDIDLHKIVELDEQARQALLKSKEH